MKYLHFWPVLCWIFLFVGFLTRWDTPTRVWIGVMYVMIIGYTFLYEVNEHINP